MTVYKYVVSTSPANWPEGHIFATIKEARESLSHYGDRSVSEEV